jgi:hypothetical protein
LIRHPGPIRILRLFPPKKWVGNREGNITQQRLHAIRNWISEPIEDDGLCDDPKIRTFFHLTKASE